jgi:release factor glutamine methyltransferase
MKKAISESFSIMKNLREILLEARRRLCEANIEDAAMNADLIAAFLLQCDRGRLPLMWENNPDEEFCENFFTAVSRRCNHEPLQYILGIWPFLDFSLKTRPGALIPRPETEEVLLAAVEAIEKQSLPENFAFVDLCTGSGVMGIALARRYTKCYGWLSDISEEALKIAQSNVNFVDSTLAGRIKVLCADLLSCFAAESLDVIISNPPYIDSLDMPGLMPEVKDFEPSLALDGGKHGLELIEKMLIQAEKCLKPKGLLVFEHGHGQRDMIEDLLKNNKTLCIQKTGDDLCSKQRYFIIEKRD